MSAPEQVPKRQQRSLRKVSPPMHRISFSRFIYALVALSAAFIAIYAYRLTTWKNEVGGWWNLATGKKPPMAGGEAQTRNRHRTKAESVEDKIEALAKALGMPSKDLASAIAVAVREYVPPASLSSVAAKETGEAAKILAEGSDTSTATEEGSSTGTVEGMIGTFVGLDEPI